MEHDGEVSENEELPNKTRTSNLINKNSLEGILAYWKEVDIEGKRNQWDLQASEITDNKEARLQSRKKLAEQTKIFKKQADEEKIKNFGSLLKLYQEEIDQLTKRCKFSEGSFISIYKVLAEAPDPVLGLTAVQEQSLNVSSTRIMELEIENKKYKTELEEFKKDFQEVQNQEVTIRHLEDKITDYEQKMSKMVEERITASESLLKAEHQQIVDQFKEQEQELRKQLSNIKGELHRVRQAFESTQTELLDLKGHYDEKQVGKQSEFEMLVDELDRARSRILVLEREKEKLNEHNYEVNKHFTIDTSTNSADLELEVAQKDIEISHLKEHIQKLEERLLGDTATLRSEIENLSDQLRNE